MESSAGPGVPLSKHCSVATALEAPPWAGTAPPWGLSFTCPFAFRAPWLTWHNTLTRCACYQPCLHVPDSAWRGPGWLRRGGDAADAWVPALREPDGFYYWAQIAAAPELERQGAPLVEFEARQSVVLGEAVAQVSPSTEYSPRAGDEVLARWEPDQRWYSPATILGLEARGSQTASKEEITVHFWNGKIATVPLGGVRRMPPAVWKKAMDRLHSPFTRELTSPLLWAPCCSLLGPVTGCVTYGVPVGTPFLCPPCHPSVCCQLLSQGGLCFLAGSTWWPLTKTSGVTAREHPKMEWKPTAQLLPLEGPKEEEGAVQAPTAVISSSEEEENLEKDREVGFPQRLMVDSTVHTDPVLLEKSLRRQGGLCQPEWRSWRRNGPEMHPGKSGG